MSLEAMTTVGLFNLRWEKWLSPETIASTGVLDLQWEEWFSVAGFLAIPAWMILILAPRRWGWLNLIPRILVPVVLSVGYSVLILLYFGSAKGGFDTLENVALLFSQDPLLLAGWVHYLAFDLFIGGWIADRADKVGIHRVFQAPILFMTFMLGPIGFLVYLIVERAQVFLQSKSLVGEGV